MFPISDENPSRSFPFVTILLIVMNLVVFGYQFTRPAIDLELFINEYALFPVEIIYFRNLPQSQLFHPLFSLVTSIFLHGSLAHLLGNLWFLWIFGDNIEDIFGHFSYLFFYLLTGIIAGVCHVYLNPDSTTPTLGASGSISGVLGAYMILFPKIRIKTVIIWVVFFQVVYIPAIFFLGVWFLFQSLGGLATLSDVGGGVAFGAHLGGFLSGLVLCFLFTRKRTEPKRFRYEPWRESRF